MSRKSLASKEFVALLIDHQQIIRSFIITQMPGSPDVRDILQEVNILLWEKMKTFERGTNFGAWACTMARYKVLEHRRREARRNQLLVFNDELSRSLAAGATSREPEDLEEKIRALNDCLGKLSDRHRRLVEARYKASSNTMTQIAAETGRSRESLRVTLSRIRRTLRDCIRKQLLREGGTL